MKVYRLAIYWAPLENDPLHQLGSQWLGRDAATGNSLPQPHLPGLDLAEITADARRYGLHATLKAPFRLRDSYAAARATARALADRTPPFALPPLQLSELNGFLALRETTPCSVLTRLAAEAVVALDDHRAPPTEEEIRRRRPEELSPTQRAHLVRWGYPYVFDAWRFHITLTRRLTTTEKAIIEPALRHFLGNVPARPRHLTAISLFVQPEPAAPFVIAERLPLRG